MSYDDTTTSSSETFGRTAAATVGRELAAAIGDCCDGKPNPKTQTATKECAASSSSCSSSSLSSWGEDCEEEPQEDEELQCEEKRDPCIPREPDCDQNWPSLDGSNSSDDESDAAASGEGAEGPKKKPASPGPAPAKTPTPETTTTTPQQPVSPPAPQGETRVEPTIIVNGMGRQLRIPTAATLSNVADHARMNKADAPMLVTAASAAGKRQSGARYKLSAGNKLPKNLPAVPIAKSTSESMKVAVSVMKKFKKPDVKLAPKNSKYMQRLARAFSALHSYASKPAASRAPVYEDEFFLASGAELNTEAVRDIEWAHTNLGHAFDATGFPFSVFNRSCPTDYGETTTVVASAGEAKMMEIGAAASAMQLHANAFSSALVARYRRMPEMETRAINDFDASADALFNAAIASGLIPANQSKTVQDAIYEHNQDALNEIDDALQGKPRIAQPGVQEYYAATGGKLSDTLNTNELLPVLALLYGNDEASARRDWQRHLLLEEAMTAEIVRSGESEAFMSARRDYIEQAFAMGLRIDSNSRSFVERSVFIDDVSLYPEDVEEVRGPDCEALRAAEDDNCGVVERTVDIHHHHYILCKPEDYTEPPIVNEDVCDVPVQPTCASVAQLGQLHRFQLADVARKAFAATGDYFGPQAGDDEQFDPARLRSDLAEFVASQVNADERKRRAVSQALIANVIQQLGSANPDQIHSLATLVINLAVTEARSLKEACDADLVPLLLRMADEIEVLANSDGNNASAPALAGPGRTQFLAKLKNLSDVFERKFLAPAANGSAAPAPGRGISRTPDERSGVARELAASMVTAVVSNPANRSRSGKYEFIERQAPFYISDTIRYPEALYDVLHGMLVGIKSALVLLDPFERSLVLDEWRTAASQIRNYANEVAGSGEYAPAVVVSPAQPQPQPQPQPQTPARQPSVTQPQPSVPQPRAGGTTPAQPRVTFTTPPVRQPTVTVAPAPAPATITVQARSRASKYDSDDDEEDHPTALKLRTKK